MAWTHISFLSYDFQVVNKINLITNLLTSGNKQNICEENANKPAPQLYTVDKESIGELQLFHNAFCSQNSEHLQIEVLFKT